MARLVQRTFHRADQRLGAHLGHLVQRALHDSLPRDRIWLPVDRPGYGVRERGLVCKPAPVVFNQGTWATGGRFERDAPPSALQRIDQANTNALNRCKKLLEIGALDLARCNRQLILTRPAQAISVDHRKLDGKGASAAPRLPLPAPDLLAEMHRRRAEIFA